MDMELGMELVLEANLPMCECNNCFMGSFLQMMRYKRSEERRVGKEC